VASGKFVLVVAIAFVDSFTVAGRAIRSVSTAANALVIRAAVVRSIVIRLVLRVIASVGIEGLIFALELLFLLVIGD
jgi:hypothetical protein